MSSWLISLVACLFSLPLTGQTFTTLYTFSPNQDLTAPAFPNSTMVETSPGVFYGTAQIGGANECGTLFSITKDGVFARLHDFTSEEGCYPQGQLIQSVDGFLYGVATGTSFSTDSPSTLFRSDLTGHVQVVASFAVQHYVQELLSPTSGPDGSIYSMVYLLEEGLGAESFLVGAYPFVYDPKTFHSFRGQRFATQNFATPLTLTSDGIYGAFPTALFRVASDAALHGFATLPNPSGSFVTALSQGPNGLLYLDGANNATGFLSSMTVNGDNYQTIQTFTNSTVCGAPITGFTRTSDGSLYAGCFGNLANDNASVFQIDPAGNYNVVYVSDQQEQVLASLSGLAAQGSDGKFYGEISHLSNAADQYGGSIYSLDLGLPKPPPAVSVFTPSSAAVGSSVIVYGSHFLAASSVKINGVSAPFTVPSGSYIKLTVPQGATTGHVTVTTPNGATTSIATLTIN